MGKGIKMTQSDDLEHLFAAARATPVAAPDAFLARVLDDALREQPVPAKAPPRRAAAPSPGLWTRLVAAVGGAAAMAGISSAAMAGLVLGYVQPDPLVSLAGDYGLATPSSDSFDLLPGYDSLLAEE